MYNVYGEVGSLVILSFFFSFPEKIRKEIIYHPSFYSALPLK